MRRPTIAWCLASAVCAGVWGCNAVLGIHDPQRAEDSGAQPPADASSEQPEVGPDGQPDAGADGQPDAQPDVLPDMVQPDSELDQSVPDVQPDQTPAEAGDAPGEASPETGPEAGITALSVGLGDEHSCAVMSNAQVRCWGRGIDGALGNGQGVDQPTPVTVYSAGTTPLGGAQEVRGGFRNTCALLPGGLKCWGYNGKGEFGDGTTDSSSTAGSGPTLAPIADFDVGSDHACAVASGTLYCWGYNNWKQVAPTGTTIVLPTAVSGLTGATRTATGYGHSCAIVTPGTVSCWGYNNSGQLGDGTNTDSTVPVQVQVCSPAGALSGANEIAAGARHVCAVMANKTVMCWGDGSSGALGNGLNNYESCAVQASGLNTAEQISAGTNHTCAIVTGGALYCWGYNADGQIGDSTKVDVLLPKMILADVVSVSLGVGHTCAARTDGTVWCWGANARGQLGTGGTTPSTKPVQVVF